ncbi:HAD family hydrolase, partial [Cutibacterium granulosum]|uniref:HAD family hydrolase n=1 Tax=Cutibacterium granulosum TaxID=33011 RepID=UPI002B22EBCA
MTSLALVATDLDHTFLGVDQRPSELNTHSMFAAAEHGAAVVFATGRPLRWLDLLEVFTDVNPTVIASNGAVTYDLRNHRVISDTPFPIDVITDV